MTVKAWMTISAVVLLLLTGTAAYRFLAPLRPPDLLATAGDTRLKESARAFCWPERSGGRSNCDREHRETVRAPALPRSGRIRVVAAYPVSPRSGYVELKHQGGDVVRRVNAWDEPLEFDLEPGRYELVAEARYSRTAFVRYSYSFRTTTRPGTVRRTPAPTASAP
ncbi:MAG TPA: hypothetical protein VNE62_05680 [Actinomycetota bacterium]|nr:hypothetical protein [Actinomycetota bacterium]